MKKTAKFIAQLDGWRGNAALYKVTPAMKYKNSKTSYVIASAASVLFSGEETYLFPATKNGDIKDWGELDGGYKGSLCHKTAFKNAGYKIVN